MPSQSLLRRPLVWTLACLLLAAAVFLTYWPALHAGFIWDDDRYIESNLLLRSADGLWQMWFQLDAVHQFYPLTFTTFWIEYHIWQLNPLGYHLDNIALHALSAIVLWRLLVRLQVKGAWAAALLFAVHPVEVESVAWATERKNVLSGLLYLLSLSAYLRTDPGRWIVSGREDRNPKRWFWYALSLLLFIGALLSKSVTSTLPAVILLLAWWKRGSIRRADIWPLLPMFVAGAAMGAVTSWVERNIVGAVGPEFDAITFFDRLCIAGRAVWFYLFKLIWPAPLTFIYPRWQIQPWFIVFTLCALAALAALWLLRRRLGRGPLVAMLFFAGTLTPALGFINVFPMRYSFVADHFQYLACIGPITLAAAAIWRYAPRPLAVCISLALAVALGIAANNQSRIYRDRKTLWLDTLSKNPDSPMVHSNLGQVLLTENDITGAQAEFERALQLRPNEPSDRINIGFCYALRGNWPQAVRWYSDALDHSPDSKQRVLRRMRGFPYYQLGTAYGAMAAEAHNNPAADRKLVQHDRDLAEDAYRRAIDLVPDYELARVNLGAILAGEGRWPEAIDQFRAAIAINPDSVNGHEQLGNALLAQHQFDDAMKEYQQMLRIDPSDSHALNNLGAAAAMQGKWDDAITFFQAALRLDPQFTLARRNLRAAQTRKQASGG